MLETPRLNIPIDELCLFVDADGTLIEIAERPENARPTAAIVSILDSLYFRLDGALAIVSGRRVEDIDRLFAPLRLPASGIHGAQLRTTANGPIVDGQAPELPPRTVSAILAIAGRYSGVFVEDKGKALAVHWRAAPSAQASLRLELDKLVAEQPADLALMEGHCVFEIKSPATSKGEAVRALMAAPPFSGRLPLFIGDDVTDIAGIAAAKELGGAGYSVGQILEGADGVFASPAEVAAFLAQLAAPHQKARTA